MEDSLNVVCQNAFSQVSQILKDNDGLIGVVVGFSLSEILRTIRETLRVRKLKGLIEDELRALKYQIPQKKDLILKMIEALKKHELLPGNSVKFLDTGYRQHFAQLYEKLTPKQKNCLHVIYGVLANCDFMMFSFEDEIKSALKDPAINDPFSAFAGRLNDYRDRLKNVEDLIESYLKGDPTDVFYIDRPLDPERRFT